MEDRLSNKPGRILITPENGSAPFYATITRADEPLQEGDALNKANLLKDQTAARYGKGNNVVPDDILAQIATELDRYSFAQAGGVKLAVGSYVGTGTAGSDNPQTLSFDFLPMMVLIVASSTGGLVPGSVFVRGQELSDGIGNHDNSAYGLALHVSWDENSISWYSTAMDDWYDDGARPSPSSQLNNPGTTYYYIAIGLGNTGLDFDRLDYLELLGGEESTETTEEEADA